MLSENDFSGAIAEKRVITIIYDGGDQPGAKRSIKPLSTSFDRMCAYCLSSRGIRTFLFAKTTLVEPDYSAPDYIPGLETDHSSSRKTSSNGALEICFTGFAKDEKENLIELAKTFNFKVVASITEGLDLLCAGYNAGPAKTKKARDRGIPIISRDQLEHLIETGEITWQNQE